MKSILIVLNILLAGAVVLGGVKFIRNLSPGASKPAFTVKKRVPKSAKAKITSTAKSETVSRETENTLSGEAMPEELNNVPDAEGFMEYDPDIAGGLYVRHLGIYAYRGGFLKRYIAEPPCALERTEKLEQLRALWMGGRIAVIRTEDEGVGVDTPEDAERVAELLRRKSGKVEE